MAKKFKPLGSRVLICRSKAKTSKGGIFLPESSQEKPREGIVKATGPGRYNEDTGKVDPLFVKVGDRVLFSSYGGTELQNISNEDEEYVILDENDLFAVLS